MFQFLLPSRRQSASRNPTAHRPLRLEMLENRYTLSGLTAALDGPAELAEAAPTPYDQELRESQSTEATLETQVPVITNFSAYVDCYGTLGVQGTVVCDEPAGLTVSIDALWESDSVTTDSYGQFIWTMALEPGDSGYVSVVTWNEIGESETAEDFVEYPE